MTESMLRRLSRRVVTVPSVVGAFALCSALLPALGLLAGLVDLARRRGPTARRSWSTLRVALFVECFLLVETLGLAALAFIGLGSLWRPRARLALTAALQSLYLRAHLTAVSRLFGLHFEVEDPDQARSPPGPALLLVRHASVIDTLLPGAFIAPRCGLRLRYVLKRELLVVPCLDVAGHWLPNHFVRRDGADTAGELESLRALAAGMGPGDGLVLFPEGTRATVAKRRRLLEGLSGEAAQQARAASLRHLLPVRPGGVLAVLRAAPPGEVLFVGHAGLEGFASVSDIWATGLTPRTIRLRVWRELSSSVPVSDEARLAWVHERWRRVDDWVDEVLATQAPQA